MEKYIIDFLQAQSAFFVDRVVSWSPVHYFPLNLIVFPLLLQFPDMAAQFCVATVFRFFKVFIVFIPSFFKGEGGQASVVLHTIRRGNIDKVVFLALGWG